MQERSDAALLFFQLKNARLHPTERKITRQGKFLRYDIAGRLYRRWLWVFRRYYTLQEATTFFHS